MAKFAPQNSLLLTSSAPETSPLIALHPLVILTISDYVTRRTLRNQQGPIIGAILGQQNGREITMEVAFESKTVVLPDGSVNFDEEWFSDRLEQCK
jgi:COP9 signalosome complex subunit 6